MTGDDYTAALRSATAELAARFHHMPLPEAEIDPVTRVLAAIATGLLDALPGGQGADVLRVLGERAVRDG